MSDAQELPSGETGRLRDPSELPRPQMWPQPPRGQQPVPISGRADDEDHGEKAARAKLPMAWTAVGLMIAGVVLVALAVVLQSWIPLVPGVLVGLAGLALARRADILADVSEGPDVRGS